MANEKTINEGLVQMKEGFNRKVFKTEYSQAWQVYLMSKDYHRAEKEMSAHGMKQPYIANILQGAFEAAWNLKLNS